MLVAIELYRHTARVEVPCSMAQLEIVRAVALQPALQVNSGVHVNRERLNVSHDPRRAHFAEIAQRLDAHDVEARRNRAGSQQRYVCIGFVATGALERLHRLGSTLWL